MVTICLQCGDEGFSNAFVFCVKCLDLAVHRYCLDTIPDTFDEDVYWVCDDCEVEVPNEPTIRNSDPVSPENCTSSRHLKANSEAKLDVPSLIAEVEVRTVEKFSQKDVEKYPGMDLVEHSQLGGDKKKKSNPTSVIDKKDFIHVVVEKAQPVYDPVWRGGFKLWNKEYQTLDGLVAHPSVKACQRVFEEAKLFPLSLHLEMLPKSDIWPRSFYSSEPSDDNIALYFFPLDARYEQDYDYLVEQMIGEELALRAVVTNAELLVFTSTELPLHHWRFRSKHYLWGVFRTKQDCSSSQMVSNGIKSVILQNAGNVLAARDQINLVKAETCHPQSPNSPLSNNASVASRTS
ncbi:PHD finger-containing protein 1-like [Lycium barbarum]|uniref:PHD finger-containing protein 1-like n=1 Tax=Lycium barbarum TaxID=112863 RepID=UPI00293EEA1B|nr:PHD finger-containing protein 1-like [Lycium barbarum]